MKKVAAFGAIAAILVFLFFFMIITAVFTEIFSEEGQAAQNQTEENTETDEGDEGGGYMIIFKGGKWIFPAPSYTRLSSPFGWRTHPLSGKSKFHKGVDLSAPGGSPILAAAPGKVIRAGNTNNGYGNHVLIDHGGGVVTLYGHASKLLVSKGQTVVAGQQIAKVGSTGQSTGNHLHFEVQLKGKVVNPAPYIFGK
mgnify:FL=1